MHLKISVASGEGTLAVTSLFRWLTRDPDARLQVTVSMAADAADGSMGSLDVINVVLSQATGIASLAVAIASWRQSRDDITSVKAIVGQRSVSLEGNPVEVARAISSLLPELDGGIAAEHGVADGASTAAGAEDPRESF